MIPTISMNHPTITSILDEIGSLEWPCLKSHKSANLVQHKLAVLADLGVSPELPEIKKAINHIVNYQSEEGAFYSKMLIPKVFGGTDSEMDGWMLCDAPLMVDILLAFGFEDHPSVKKAVEHLLSNSMERGWSCAASIPNFGGPGRKADPCPYSTLLNMRALSHVHDFGPTEKCNRGLEFILDFWEEQKDKKYRLFGIGTDFRKLKYPFIWFDILHVVEVLSRFPQVYKDKRFIEMIDIIESKADENGNYTPESVWMAFKGLDFAQKKETSPTMTFMVKRIMDRLTNLIPLLLKTD